MRFQYCSLISRTDELKTQLAARGSAATVHIQAALIPILASFSHLALNDFELAASMQGAALPLNLMGAFITAVNTHQAVHILRAEGGRGE